MIVDTETESFTGFIGEHSREDAESRALDLNKGICPLVQTEDGELEYMDPMPERYKAVRITIEDLE